MIRDGTISKLVSAPGCRRKLCLTAQIVSVQVSGNSLVMPRCLRRNYKVEAKYAFISWA